VRGNNGAHGGPLTCLDNEYLDEARGMCIQCHPECNGCTGAANTDCKSCRNFANGLACVSSCAELGMSVSPNSTCVSCNAQCNATYGCSGSLPRNCIACIGLQFEDSCVAMCPDQTFVSTSLPFVLDFIL
jgi:hypothetical protein